MNTASSWTRHEDVLQMAIDRAVRDGFSDECVYGDALSSDELEALDMSLFFFKNTWEDNPLQLMAAECPSAVAVTFALVDFDVSRTIMPFQRLRDYRFASRRLYNERQALASERSAQFMSPHASIDTETRQLLARARVTMRVRTLTYDFGTKRLFAAPSNAFMGFLV